MYIYTSLNEASTKYNSCSRYATEGSFTFYKLFCNTFWFFHHSLSSFSSSILFAGLYTIYLVITLSPRSNLKMITCKFFSDSLPATPVFKVQPSLIPQLTPSSQLSFGITLVSILAHSNVHLKWIAGKAAKKSVALFPHPRIHFGNTLRQ